MNAKSRRKSSRNIIIAASLISMISTLAFADDRSEFIIKKAKDAVRYHLKDPSSARFRNVRLTAYAVCGEVNSKNSFGAMTGFIPFMSGGGTENTFFPSNFAKGEFEKTWNQACR